MLEMSSVQCVSERWRCRCLQTPGEWNTRVAERQKEHRDNLLLMMMLLLCVIGTCHTCTGQNKQHKQHCVQQHRIMTSQVTTYFYDTTATWHRQFIQKWHILSNLDATSFFECNFQKNLPNINGSLTCATSQNHEHLMLRRLQTPF